MMAGKYNYKHQPCELDGVAESGQPLTAALREARHLMRFFSLVGIVTMLHCLLFVELAVAAEVHHRAQAEKQIVLQGSPEQQLNQALLKVQEIADTKQRTITQRLADESNLLNSLLDFFGLSQLQLEEVDNLEQLNGLLSGLNQTAMEQFQQTEALLLQKQLPAEILQRHADTVAHYQTQFAELSVRLKEVLRADSLQTQGKAMDALDQLMEQQKLKKSHQSTNPEQLPWRTPDPSKVRKPGQSADELSRLTGISPLPQGVMVAAHTLPADIFSLLGGPVPEDLMETTDIRITDAIRDLAENQLGDDPVAIYNWVRNNIEFVPSYGSIQGADYTLQHRKGNAFDTASLLIALLRAANIPARYAYGTVRIPSGQVMNWVGNADVPQAAQQILGQGGIPNVGIINSGRVTHIEMEHIWVEAWVDYFPSRGAKHSEGDQWLPLDASFKQYTYSDGLDFQNNLAFDANGLVDHVTSNSTADDNSVSGFPSDYVSQRYSDFTAQLEQYIAEQGDNLLASDVLGAKTVIEVDNSQLSSGLPYELVERTDNFSVLPDNLRHKIQFTLQESTSSFFGFSSHSDVFKQEFALPELAGKSLSLSFTPADDAAHEVFLSFIPETDVTSSNVPLDVPGYLLQLRAQLAVDGEVVKEGGSFNMGEETNNKMRIFSPSFGWESSDASGVAGEYRAIGLDLGGYSSKHLEKIAADTEQMRQFIEDALPDPSVDKHFLMGALTQANIATYFAMNDYMNDIHSRQRGIIEYRLPSYGYFFTALSPAYFFGIPRQVKTSGVTMDVPYLQAMSYAADNDRDRWIEYNRATGYRASYLENLVPELLMSTDGAPLDGVSAAKILNLAVSQGQTVYKLTAANMHLLSGVQVDGDTRRDIRNALNAGKEVTIHNQPISVQNWNGFGYLVIDPETGAGAYLISGGANGGSIFDALLGFVGWILGMIDGAYGHWSASRTGKIIFSKIIKNAQRALKASLILGLIALTLSVVSIFRDGFSWNAVGAAAISILAFALTAFLISIVASFTGIIGGAILGGLIAVAINSLASRLTQALF